MFKFTIKYLGFLKVVPLLALFFDSLLKLWTFIANAEIMVCLDDIENSVLSWGDTSASMHKYGGLQFNCHGKEIGHIHGNGLLDIRFNRKIKQQLMKEGRIIDHHTFTNSGWISFYITKKEDYAYAIKLLKMAYTAIKQKGQLHTSTQVLSLNY